MKKENERENKGGRNMNIKMRIKETKNERKRMKK